MKIATKDVFIILLLICFSIGRFFMPHQNPSFPGTYQAFAHIFVGALFGAYFASKDKTYLWYGLGFTAVEVLAFFTR